jgi:hypothetical protein
MDWQPISTAPSRKRVLVWESGEKIPRIAVNFRDKEGDYWQAGCDEDGWSDELYPVCWAPIPAKPDLRKFKCFNSGWRVHAREVKRRRLREQKSNDKAFRAALKESGWSYEDERAAGNIGRPPFSEASSG